MNLVTPLGEILILIDNIEIDYEYIKVAPEKLCSQVDGRYKIKINFIPDKNNHQISCIIKNHKRTKMDSVESGEFLALQSFFKDKTKLSIGTIDDEYNEDYSNSYLYNGVAYDVLPTTQAKEYIFMVCWINNCDSEEKDLQTWFGADPTFLEDEKNDNQDNSPIQWMGTENGIIYKKGFLEDYNFKLSYGIEFNSKIDARYSYMIFKNVIFVLSKGNVISSSTIKKYSDKYANIILYYEGTPKILVNELITLLEKITKKENIEYAFITSTIKELNFEETKTFLKRGYKKFNEINKEQLEKCLGANVYFDETYRKKV